jgi:hypothetical protein
MKSSASPHITFQRPCLLMPPRGGGEDKMSRLQSICLFSAPEPWSQAQLWAPSEGVEAPPRATNPQWADTQHQAPGLGSLERCKTQQHPSRGSWSTVKADSLCTLITEVLRTFCRLPRELLAHCGQGQPDSHADDQTTCPQQTQEGLFAWLL